MSPAELREYALKEIDELGREQSGPELERGMRAQIGQHGSNEVGDARAWLIN